MYKIQSGFKMPMPRRNKNNMTPSPSEQRMFDAYISAYRKVNGCTLTFGSFDVESRIQVFRTPGGNVEAHTARRCKELVRQLNFRKA